MEIKTFGCKLNHYDSLLIKKQLSSLRSKKNIVILNSCAVTAQAGKEIRKTAEKIKKSSSNNFVVITGCGAQVETELYKNSQFVDLVVGNSDRKNLKNIIEQSLLQKNTNKVIKSNIFKTKEIYSDFVSPSSDRTRAFLKIQDGCDSFCSFCIIPFARGKSKSLSTEFLKDSIQKLEDKDIKEVVLTGVHIGDYKDGETGLEGLIEYLLKTTHIPRIRLTSLEPIEITDRLLDCYQNERMCPHFHISLQSTNSKVLKSMKRKYSQKEVEQAFKNIAKFVPKAFVGMDIIVGFPTESKQDFEESCHLLKNHSWTNMHVFPYSKRLGTYSAFKYEALDQKEVVRRADILRKLSEERFQEKRKKQIGTYKKVLLFKKNNKTGLSRDYWKIKTPASDFKGEKRVFISGLDSNTSSLKAEFCFS
ncbi:MAG: tRNA (N(6)-L-threonylcarbamoyladenosine(37)-C(2))-methylthiotransferase MtaB [Bdellovibrionaceae bacterium]|nr:tRNA (N(6)-L-threonylcarbamoyladenosine(37)-C(2))-methylthiotransferase MtaB [Pseudobdellovibrionaceae bacterium]